jgi:hypothetical protein
MVKWDNGSIEPADYAFLHGKVFGHSDDRVQWRPLVNTSINIRNHTFFFNFLNRWTTIINFSTRIFLNYVGWLEVDHTYFPSIYERSIIYDRYKISFIHSFINPSIHPSIHSFIHSFIQRLYSPLLGPGLFFSFVIFFYTVGRTPWTSDQPVLRPLPTYDDTNTE